MRHLPGLMLSAAAIFLSGTALVPSTPARAAVSFNINFGFNTFHDRLSDGGRWLHSPVWGDVWRPRRGLVGADFQPYTNGYWEFTDEYGWYWVSEDPFDDVVYHYGRWVYDPDLNWVWIPGYTWGPGWVVWRDGGGYSGWMPMPPDEAFISGTGLSLGMNFGSWGANFYGYNRWYGNRVDPGRFWVFVDSRNLANRDYRRFVVPRERARIIINNTRNVTRFVVVNNRVVNRSIDVRVVERASGHRIVPVPARQVIKPNAIVTTVDESNRIRQRERAQHPIGVGFVKGGAGANGNQPGNGRPGGAMGGAGGNQGGLGAAITGGPSNGTGGRKDRGPQQNGSSGNAMTGSPNGTGNEPATGPDNGPRGPHNPAGGAAPSDNGAAAGAGGAEKPKHERNNSDGGTMTGPAGSPGTTSPGDNGAAAGTGADKPKHERNNNSGAATGPSDNGAAPESGGPEKPKREHNNNAGGSMTGPAQNGATPSSDNAAPSTGPNSATRAPRGITPSDNTTNGASGNNPSQPPEPRHRAPGTTNGPGPNSAAQTPGGGSTVQQQQPDQGTAPKKKNPKHNQQGTTPDSGTPQ